MMSAARPAAAEGLAAGDGAEQRGAAAMVTSPIAGLAAAAGEDGGKG